MLDDLIDTFVYSLSDQVVKMKTGEEEEEGMIRVVYFPSMKLANNTFISHEKKSHDKKDNAELELHGNNNEVNVVLQHENKGSDNDTVNGNKYTEKEYKKNQQRELVSKTKKQACKIFDPSTQFLNSTYIGEVACLPAVWTHSTNIDHGNDTECDDKSDFLPPGANTNIRNYTALPRFMEKTVVAEEKIDSHLNNDNDQKLDLKENELPLEMKNKREVKSDYQNDEGDRNYRNSRKYNDYDSYDRNDTRMNDSDHKSKK